MMINRRVLGVAAVLCLLLGQIALAEQRGGRGRGGGGRGRGRAPATVTFSPQAQTEEELDAYRAIEAEQSIATRLTLLSDFLTAFPDSELTYVIQRLRMAAFMQAGNFRSAIPVARQTIAAHTAFFEAKSVAVEALPEPPEDWPGFQISFANAKSSYLRTILDAHNRMGDMPMVIESGLLAVAAEQVAYDMYIATVEEGSPEYQQTFQQHSQTGVTFTQTLMAAYQETNNSEKTIEYAEMALDTNPQDLLALITLSTTLAERPADDEDERESQMEIAEGHAKTAVMMVEAIVNGPDSAQMSPGQKGELRSAVHSTLGLVYLNQDEFGDAQTEYQTALEAKADDPIAHFRLGLAYAQDNNKTDEAMESLARSIFLKGVTEAQARDILTQMWESLQRTPEAMEEFIQEEGGKIGSN